MNKIILHIPHSSVNIPNKEGYIVDDTILNREILKLTDWYTDDLFYSSSEISIVANFSRIFCDLERFADDKHEVMAGYGMGVCYEKRDNGRDLRIVSKKLKEIILNQYYWKIHNKLTNAVGLQLKYFKKATIIDCHSFPDIPFERDLIKEPNRPDFSIGIDDFHTPEKLIKISEIFFKEKGYSLGINSPYKGTIVPLVYYKKNQNVQSIMLEVNRKLYLKDSSNEKSKQYLEIKKVVNEFIYFIKNYQ